MFIDCLMNKAMVDNWTSVCIFNFHEAVLVLAMVKSSVHNQTSRNRPRRLARNPRAQTEPDAWLWIHRWKNANPGQIAISGGGQRLPFNVRRVGETGMTGEIAIRNPCAFPDTRNETKCYDLQESGFAYHLTYQATQPKIRRVVLGNSMSIQEYPR